MHRRAGPVRPAPSAAQYEHALLILTSNLPFSSWPACSAITSSRAAMIDRIIRHAYVIALRAPPTGSVTAVSRPFPALSRARIPRLRTSTLPSGSRAPSITLLRNSGIGLACSVLLLASLADQPTCHQVPTAELLRVQVGTLRTGRARNADRPRARPPMVVLWCLDRSRINGGSCAFHTHSVGPYRRCVAWARRRRGAGRLSLGAVRLCLLLLTTSWENH